VKFVNLNYDLNFKFYFMYIPEQMYFKNCRSMLTVDSWNKIRKIVLKRDNYTCQCCGSKINLEVHEIFKVYPEKYNILKYAIKYIQKDIYTYFRLTQIVTLCKLCHQSVHIKRAYVKNDGSLQDCINHLAKIFKISKEDVDRYINKFVFNSYNLKNRYKHYIFKLDLEYLFKIAFENKIDLDFTCLSFKVPKKYTSYIKDYKLHVTSLNK